MTDLLLEIIMSQSGQVKVYFIIFDDIISALILQVERLESSV
jgi:hypothetical protein